MGDRQSPERGAARSRKPGYVRPARTVTVAQAAELTGISRTAIEARIGRGTLPATKVGTRVHILLADLYRLNLIRLDPAATVTDLLDRLERQAERIGQLEELLRRLGVALPE
jgi:excisionase family DNA binding protein